MEECARCPFFVAKSREEKFQITITHELPHDNFGFQVISQLRFFTKRERKDFYELFCADRYENCPFFKEIEKKYEKKNPKKG